MFTKIYKILVISLLVSFIGCDSINESFTEGFSEDPNNPTDAPADRVFVAAQIGTMTFLESHPARVAGMWSQYFTGQDRQYTALYNYTIQGGTEFDSNWFVAYVRGLSNIQIAREKYEERDVVPEVQVAVTKVLEALLMGQVTSLWGDVPYEEANRPDEIEEPVYDSQSDVYNNINTLLDDAISVLQNASAPVADDVTSLGGDAAKWLRVAYTLKARYLMHTGDTAGALDAAENGIDAADGTGDMMVLHATEVNRDMNLYYNFMVQQRSGYMGANDSHSGEMLENGSNAKTNEEDRYNFYYTGTGADRDVNLEEGGFAARDASFPVVTYFENQAIIAEAEALEGTVAADQRAIDALNNTREFFNNKFGDGNYDELNLLDFQAGGIYGDTTILNHIYDWTYLGLIGQIEGYNFLRRIDFDVEGLEPVTGETFPLRFIYPQSERNTNSNVPSPAPGSFEATPVNQ